MIGGDHWFRPLAVHTGLDQPFLGVPLTQYGHLNIEEFREKIAAEVAQTLLTLHPGKPYFLGGWCANGITAYEVARALEANGGRVGLLVEFDAMNPDYYRSLRSVVHSTARAARSVRSILKSGLRNGLAAAIRSVFGKVFERVRYIFRSRYTCLEVPFPILVLRPPSFGVEDPELGWRRVCPKNLAVVEVPGEHNTIFREPNVRSMGNSLRRQLDLSLNRLAEKPTK